MVTKKDRRHSGRTISKIYHPDERYIQCRDTDLAYRIKRAIDKINLSQRSIYAKLIDTLINGDGTLKCSARMLREDLCEEGITATTEKDLAIKIKKTLIPELRKFFEDEGINI